MYLEGLGASLWVLEGPLRRFWRSWPQGVLPMALPDGLWSFQMPFTASRGPLPLPESPHASRRALTASRRQVPDSLLTSGQRGPRGSLGEVWEAPKTEEVFSEGLGRVLGGAWGGFGALGWSLGRSWDVQMLIFR